MKTQHSQYPKHPLLTALVCSVVFAGFCVGKIYGAENAVVDTVVELLKGSDRDMRTLALQQIREELPGQAVTLRLAALLPELPPVVQVELVDALGERGDPAARPAMLQLLKSQTQAIRVKALGALAHLASPEDIPALARLAAAGPEPERQAARQTLRQVSGNAMNAAMIETLKKAESGPKVELMSALVDRRVTQALPVVVKNVDDADLAVRLAVLDALRTMGDEKHTALVVKHLKSTKDQKERKQASRALLALCKRGQGKCADTVIAGFAGADPAARVLLLRALPLADGPKALRETVARLQDKDQGVRDEALRVLAGWPDRAAMSHLKQLARDIKHLKNHVLALRGMVRLASPTKDRKPDLASLKEAMQLATRRQEKVLVLGALGKVPTTDSLALVASALNQPALAEDAGLAAVLIAEKIKDPKSAQVRAVLQQVTETVKNQKTRDRAKQLLEGPQP